MFLQSSKQKGPQELAEQRPVMSGRVSKHQKNIVKFALTVGRVGPLRVCQQSSVSKVSWFVQWANTAVLLCQWKAALRPYQMPQWWWWRQNHGGQTTRNFNAMIRSDLSGRAVLSLVESLNSGTYHALLWQWISYHGKLSYIPTEVFVYKLCWPFY